MAEGVNLQARLIGNRRNILKRCSLNAIYFRGSSSISWSASGYPQAAEFLDLFLLVYKKSAESKFIFESWCYDYIGGGYSAFFPVISAFFPVHLPFFRCNPQACLGYWLARHLLFCHRSVRAEKPERWQKWRCA
jgi:hypothetical protein